jgi:hypothetical protein
MRMLARLAQIKPQLTDQGLAFRTKTGPPNFQALTH